MSTNQISPENNVPDEAPNGDFVYAVAAVPGPVPGEHGAIFAARSSGLYRSDDGGQTWWNALESLHLEETIPVLSLAISPAFERDGMLIAGSSGGVFRSTDGGTTWKALLLPPPPPTISTLVMSPHFERDETVFAGTMEDGVFISTDGGERWVAWNFGLLDLNILCLAISPGFQRDETIFAGAESGIFRSTNGGRAWRDIELPFGFEAVLSLAVSPDFDQNHTIFAGTENRGLWASHDEGDTWMPQGAFDDPVDGIIFTGQSILALVGGVLWQSQDGETWKNCVPAKFSDREILSIEALNGQKEAVLVGFLDGGVESIPLA